MESESHGKSKDSKVFEMFQEHASDLLTSADDQILGLILESGSVSVFTDLVEQDYNNFYKKMMSYPGLMNAINVAVVEELEGNDKINEPESFNMIDDISSFASSSSIIDEKDDDNIILLNEDKGVFSEADMERAVEESKKTYEVEKQVKSEMFFGFRDENGFDREELKRAIKESEKSYEKENDELRGFGGAHMGKTLDKFGDMYSLACSDSDKVLSFLEEWEFKDSKNYKKKKPVTTKYKTSFWKKIWKGLKSLGRGIKNLFTPSVEKQVEKLDKSGLFSNHSGDSVSMTSSEDRNKDSLIKSISNVEENREYDLNSSNVSNVLDQSKSINEIMCK